MESVLIFPAVRGEQVNRQGEQQEQDYQQQQAGYECVHLFFLYPIIQVQTDLFNRFICAIRNKAITATLAHLVKKP